MWSADVGDVGPDRREQRPMIMERWYAPPLVGLRGRGMVDVAHTEELDTGEPFDRLEVDDRDVATSDDRRGRHVRLLFKRPPLD
jgi:hypothetical protein